MTILYVQVEGTDVRQVEIDIELVDGKIDPMEMRQKAIDQFQRENGSYDQCSVSGWEVAQ